MRNGLKVVLCFGRVHKVFFPFFNKISCKLYFQESLTKGSDTFCLAITCCCSILKILQKHPKKSLANYSFASISLATLATTWLYLSSNMKNIARYFANHSLERVAQWAQYSGILAALFGLKYCNIPSLPSSSQPSSCSGHLQFQYSTSPTQLHSEQQILMRIVLKILSALSTNLSIVVIYLRLRCSWYQYLETFL